MGFLRIVIVDLIYRSITVDFNYLDFMDQLGSEDSYVTFLRAYGPLSQNVGLWGSLWANLGSL